MAIAAQHLGAVWPKSAAEGSTSGSRLQECAAAASRSVSHWLVCTLNSMVRLALLTSVTWRRPPVSCQISQLSTVPKASSPAGCGAAPGTWSSSHCSLVPEK
jgi:hypothetical protein